MLLMFFYIFGLGGMFGFWLRTRHTNSIIVKFTIVATYLLAAFIAYLLLLSKTYPIIITTSFIAGFFIIMFINERYLGYLIIVLLDGFTFSSSYNIHEYPELYSGAQLQFVYLCDIVALALAGVTIVYFFSESFRNWFRDSKDSKAIVEKPIDTSRLTNDDLKELLISGAYLQAGEERDSFYPFSFHYHVADNGPLAKIDPVTGYRYWRIEFEFLWHFRLCDYTGATYDKSNNLTKFRRLKESLGSESYSLKEIKPNDYCGKFLHLKFTKQDLLKTVREICEMKPSSLTMSVKTRADHILLLELMMFNIIVENSKEITILREEEDARNLSSNQQAKDGFPSARPSTLNDIKTGGFMGEIKH